MTHKTQNQNRSQYEDIISITDKNYNNEKTAPKTISINLYTSRLKKQKLKKQDSFTLKRNEVLNGIKREWDLNHSPKIQNDEKTGTISEEIISNIPYREKYKEYITKDNLHSKQNELSIKDLSKESIHLRNYENYSHEKYLHEKIPYTSNLKNKSLKESSNKLDLNELPIQNLYLNNISNIHIQHNSSEIPKETIRSLNGQSKKILKGRIRIARSNSSQSIQSKDKCFFKDQPFYTETLALESNINKNIVTSSQNKEIDNLNTKSEKNNNIKKDLKQDQFNLYKLNPKSDNEQINSFENLNDKIDDLNISNKIDEQTMERIQYYINIKEKSMDESLLILQKTLKNYLLIFNNLEERSQKLLISKLGLLVSRNVYVDKLKNIERFNKINNLN